MEAAGRRYSPNVRFLLSSWAQSSPVLSCATRSVADGGRRPTILGFDFDLDFGFALLV
jgi:hypothetical protein